MERGKKEAPVGILALVAALLVVLMAAPTAMARPWKTPLRSWEATVKGLVLPMPAGSGYCWAPTKYSEPKTTVTSGLLNRTEQ
jgi:hypothetical protein